MGGDAVEGVDMIEALSAATFFYTDDEANMYLRQRIFVHKVFIVGEVEGRQYLAAS